MSITNNFPTTLTDDQKSALNKIESFLSSDANCFLLKGYAGTGKTFLMEGLVKYLDEIGRSVVLMAPTGRAAMVIGNKTKRDATTIHKGIYDFDELVDDASTFRFHYKLNLNTNNTDTVYIIDESSMLADVFSDDEFFVFGTGFLLQDLFSFVDFNYRPNSKIIFIGDNAQLPPVGMNFSPALDKDYLSSKYQLKVDEFELKEVKRQGQESGILLTATMLRNSLESDQFNRFEINNSNDITKLKNEEFEASYFKAVNNAVSENTIVITHSNKQAQEYNFAIRERFFPGQPEIQSGDVLINTKNNYSTAVEIYNGQFIKVISASTVPELPRTIRFYRKGGELAEVTFVFRDIVAELKDLGGNTQQVKCKSIDNFLKNDFPKLAPIEQQALYVDFKNRFPHLKPGTRDFKDEMKADLYFNAFQVKYGYAITCHKSQGGEWENAFVDLQAYMKVLSKGFFRWAYTGITRSKTNLFVIGSKSFSPLDQFVIQPITSIVHPIANQHYISSDYAERQINLQFSLPILKSKYVEICDKLKDQNVEISISSLSWVERYTFSRNGKSVTFDFNYGNKGFTTSRVINSSDEEFTQFIKQKISEPLIIDFKYNAPNTFQLELYNMLKEISMDENLLITNIINERYCDRYFFQTEASCAYLNCIYNGKGIYTTIMPHSTKGELDHKLQSIIKRLL